MTDKVLLLLAALAPTSMSLIGIIFAKSDLKDFKAEVRHQQEEMAKKLDTVMAAGHKDALEIMRQMNHTARARRGGRGEAGTMIATNG